MGKHADQEDKQALVELVKEEIEAHKMGEIDRLSTNGELAEVLRISGYTTGKVLSQGLDNETRVYRKHQIQSQTIKRLNANPEFKEASRERCRTLNADSEFKEASRERGRERMKALYATPQVREKIEARHADPKVREERSKRMKKLWEDPTFRAKNIERMKTRHADPKVREANSKRGSKRMKKLWEDPAFQEASKKRNQKRIDQMRKSSYHIEGRFHPASQQEGAVALLLEKYVPDYTIKEKETFQVRDNGIDNGGLDFLVNGEFLEWHPIILTNGKRGDIPNHEEAKSYKKVVASLSPEERKEFEEDYKQVLALNYRNSRQGAVDNSGYSGTNVALAGDLQGLYGFLEKYSTSLPTFQEFKTEFNQKVKYVKGFKVKKEEPEAA